MTTLDTLSEGRSGLINELDGDSTFLSRITEMGFTPDTEVLSIRNGKKGPLLFEIRGTIVAVGRKEAEKVWIKEIV